MIGKETIKKNNSIANIKKNSDPIDLYRFMYDLGELSDRKHILVTDAGSNYFIGGQAWRFEKGQKEIASTTNAAMGLSVPLSIGAAVASGKQVLSVTGDGSIELNIQELKTISHYNLNIKTFVINNGGYASIRESQDEYSDGRYTEADDILDFSKVAQALTSAFGNISKLAKCE